MVSVSLWRWSGRLRPILRWFFWTNPWVPTTPSCGQTSPSAQERPGTDGTVQCRVVNRLFRGHRVPLDVAVDNTVIQAYTDINRCILTADGPVWLGWNASSQTLVAE